MKNLTREEAKSLCDEFLEGKYTDKEIAEILVFLAKKGETAEEIVGFSDSLLSRSEPFPFQEPVVDVCGTGGSMVDRFNVSTTVAFILASLGIKVAKHGNRGSRKPNGSFDFLEELGVNIDVGGDVLSKCLDEISLAFIFARKFHPAMRAVAEARKMVGHRTIFNLAGPISNPANIRTQIIGTVDVDGLNLFVDVGKIIGRKILVVSGHPQIDELSICGVSVIAFSEGKKEITPEEMELKRCVCGEILCGDAKSNAKEFLKLIEGQGSRTLEDLICANAGLAIAFVENGENITMKNIKDGIGKAREAIRSGRVKEKFMVYKNAVK